MATCDRPALDGTDRLKRKIQHPKSNRVMLNPAGPQRDKAVDSAWVVVVVVVLVVVLVVMVLVLLLW